MTEKAWKRVERMIARYLGGRRVPINGRIRGSAPDVEHAWLSIEVKDRRVLPDWLLDAMAQAKASARGDQLPIAVLHQRGMWVGDSLIVMRARDFRDWFGGDSIAAAPTYVEADNIGPGAEIPLGSSGMAAL